MEEESLGAAGFLECCLLGWLVVWIREMEVILAVQYGAATFVIFKLLVVLSVQPPEKKREKALLDR